MKPVHPRFAWLDPSTGLLLAGFAVAMMGRGLDLGGAFATYATFGALFLMLAYMGSRPNSFLNPFTPTLVVIPYFGALLAFNADLDPEVIQGIGLLYLLAAASLRMGFLAHRRPGQVQATSEWPGLRRPMAVFLLGAALTLSLTAYWYGLHSEIKVLKGIALILEPVSLALLFGCVAALAHGGHVARAVLLTLGFLGAVHVGTLIFEGESNRFYYLRGLLLVILILMAVYRNRFKPISRAGLLAAASLVLISAMAILLTDRENLLEFGGDFKIISNVADIVDAFDNGGFRHEPFMFLFNLGPNLTPDWLWPGHAKPIDYNPSAWWYENVYGLDPDLGKWGIGVGGIGGAYIYGGIAGIVLVYYLTGLLLAALRYRATSPFSIGVYFYYTTQLPYALFRMDDSFMWGPALFTLPLIFLALRVANAHPSLGAGRA